MAPWPKSNPCLLHTRAGRRIEYGAGPRRLWCPEGVVWWRPRPARARMASPCATSCGTPFLPGPRRDRNIYCSDCGIKAASRDAGGAW